MWTVVSDREYFHHPERFLCAPQIPTPAPRLLATNDLLSVAMVFTFLEFHVNGISQFRALFYLGFFTKHNVVYSGGFFLYFPKHHLDPFGGDPFKESDPFRGSASDDFFKKQTKNDPFTSDPFTKNPPLPSKVSEPGKAMALPV